MAPQVSSASDELHASRTQTTAPRTAASTLISFLRRNVLLRFDDAQVEAKFRESSASQSQISSLIWMVFAVVTSFPTITSRDPVKSQGRMVFIGSLPIYLILLVTRLASFRYPKMNFWVWRVGGPLFVLASCIRELLFLRGIHLFLSSSSQGGVCVSEISTQHSYLTGHPFLSMLAFRLLWFDYFMISLATLIGFAFVYPVGSPCASYGAIGGLFSASWMFLYVWIRASRGSFHKLQRAQEAVLRQREDATRRAASLTRLIQSAGAPIVGVDTQGSITVWNDAVASLTGCPPPQALGRPLCDSFVLPHGREAVRAVLSRTAAGEHLPSFELPLQAGDGSEAVLLLSADPQIDGDGGCTHVVCVGQDVTSRVRMERARRTFLASFSHELRTPLNGLLGMLEVLCRQPGPRVTRKRARVAFSSAKHLQGLINDICDLSRIESGHMALAVERIRLPSVLRGTAQLLQHQASERGVALQWECDPAIPSPLLGDSMRLGQILVNLAYNGLKFTPRGGRVSLQCKLLQHVCNAAHIPRPQAGGSGSSSDGSSDGASGTTGKGGSTASAGSASATAAAAAEVEAEDPSLFAPHGYCVLRLRVQDTGCGIAAADIPKLFTMFTRLSASAELNPTGSGLGLAISRRLVQLMHGDFRVESVPGLGSSFIFTVALKCPPPSSASTTADADATTADATTANDAAADTASSVEGSMSALRLTSPFVDIASDEDCDERTESESKAGVVAAGRDPAVTPLNILLVEDNTFNKEVVEAYLEDTPHSLTWVHNGQLAVDAVTARPPDAAAVPTHAASASDQQQEEEQRRRRFDVILMDCGMPVMDGYEATARIREWEETAAAPPSHLPPGTPRQRTPIVGLTAYAMVGDVERCLAAGMDQCLTKPVGQALLLNTITRWAHATTAADAAADATPAVSAPTAAASAAATAAAAAAGGGRSGGSGGSGGSAASAATAAAASAAASAAGVGRDVLWSMDSVPSLSCSSTGSGSGSGSGNGSSGRPERSGSGSSTPTPGGSGSGGSGSGGSGGSGRGGSGSGGDSFSTTIRPAEKSERSAAAATVTTQPRGEDQLPPPAVQSSPAAPGGTQPPESVQPHTASPPAPASAAAGDWLSAAVAAAAASSEEGLDPPVDLHAARASFGDPALLRQFLRRFASHCRRSLAAVDAAMTSGDVATVSREGHSLKGASGYIGAGRVNAAARLVQDTARAEGAAAGQPQVVEAVEQLRACCAEACTWILATVPEATAQATAQATAASGGGALLPYVPSPPRTP